MLLRLVLIVFVIIASIVDIYKMTLTLGDLKQELLDLKAEIARKDSDVKAELAKKDKTIVTKVIQSNQKLRKFAGDTKDVKDWVIEAKRAVNLQGLDGRHAVDFILSHLEKEARQEIRYTLDEETCTVEEVYEGFAELVTANEALDEFYSRKQEEEESIRDFSYGLMNLLERVVTIDPTCVANKDLFLRERFMEKIREKYLRKYLKSRIRQNPGMKFKEVREEALCWAEEDMGSTAKPQKKKAFAHEVGVSEDPQLCEPAQSSGFNLLQKELKETKCQLGQLIEMQKQQQELLSQQQKLITPLATNKDKESKTSANKPGETCFFCKKPGRRKEDCYKFKATKSPLGSGAASQMLYMQSIPTVQAQSWMPVAQGGLAPPVVTSTPGENNLFIGASTNTTANSLNCNTPLQ